MKTTKRPPDRYLILFDGQPTRLTKIAGLSAAGIPLPHAAATRYQSEAQAHRAVNRVCRVAKRLRASLVVDFLRPRCPELEHLFAGLEDQYAVVKAT